MWHDATFGANGPGGSNGTSFVSDHGFGKVRVAEDGVDKMTRYCHHCNRDVEAQGAEANSPTGRFCPAWVWLCSEEKWSMY